MNKNWRSFSSLEIIPEGKHGCFITALGQVGICKIFGVAYGAFTLTLMDFVCLFSVPEEQDKS